MASSGLQEIQREALQPDRRASPTVQLQRLGAGSALLLATLLVAAPFTHDVTARLLLRTQDFWLVLLSVVLMGLALVPVLPIRRPLAADRRLIVLLSLAVALIAYAGHYWLLFGYDFTRDEQMASFDTTIFQAGRLAFPLPVAWQDHASELNLRFMLAAAHQLAWVSAYLPVSAALRALFGLAGDPALAGPTYTGFSVLLLWSCARRIWPNKPETALACVMMAIASGQFLITGMTAYAMPAHLFFNLLWLRLFLANRRTADLGAVAAGFAATGLHQPLFHPMFVAPFMLVLLAERNWRRLAIFVAAYAVIGAFWFYWPIYVQGLIATPHAVAVTDADYLSRLVDALSANHDNVFFMAANLLRFCTWQNVLLLPLLAASWPLVCRDRLAGALAAGLLLTAFAMAIILPGQGQGFGYRYFHGLIGNAALLAGYGWNRFEGAMPAIRSSVVRATAASVVVLMPVQAWMAHRLYAPFAEANARIDASGADYALIPEADLTLLHDLVYNLPDLSNRPIRLLEPLVHDPAGLARRICRPGVTVALFPDRFFDPIQKSFSLRRKRSADARLAIEAGALKQAGCGVRTLE